MGGPGAGGGGGGSWASGEGRVVATDWPVAWTPVMMAGRKYAKPPESAASAIPMMRIAKLGNSWIRQLAALARR